jgi:hypothetical protein
MNHLPTSATNKKNSSSARWHGETIEEKLGFQRNELQNKSTFKEIQQMKKELDTELCG